MSLSYDGDTRASYLLLDDHDDDHDPWIRRVEYDVESEAEELRVSGLPHADWLSCILRTGKYCRPPNGL